jgi:hypothetical protein
MTNISTSSYRFGDPVVAARPRVNPTASHLVTTDGSWTMVGASTKRPARPLGAST